MITAKAKALITANRARLAEQLAAGADREVLLEVAKNAYHQSIGSADADELLAGYVALIEIGTEKVLDDEAIEFL